ncbi:MAG: hypothetical protein Q4F72_12095, partial [Desulfovibrionaceae bacterium]|nr:hypothetical protein [Desulfovibrionaceae bacterium]
SLPRWLLILLGLLLLLLLLLALLGIIPGLLPSGCSRTDQPVPAPAVQEQSAGEPKAPAEPAPKEEAPAASGEQMNIPEEAAKANDLSFLEGCWRSNTGLVNQDGIAVTTEYCFDARGEGTRSLIETGPEGLRCSGPATARFSQDSLQIEAEEAVCSDNRNTYVGQSVVCTGSGSATICSGREKSSNNSWQAGFVRR